MTMLLTGVDWHKFFGQLVWHFWMTVFTWALCSAVFDDSHSEECWITTTNWVVSLAVFGNSFYLAVCSTAFDDSPSRECWMIIVCFAACFLLERLVLQALMTMLPSKEPFAVAFGKNVSNWSCLFDTYVLATTVIEVFEIIWESNRSLTQEMWSSVFTSSALIPTGLWKGGAEKNETLERWIQSHTKYTSMAKSTHMNNMLFWILN